MSPAGDSGFSSTNATEPNDRSEGHPIFAVNHAATALLLKKRWPDVPLVWLLLSVQVLEIGWVLLNLLGVERTTTEIEVHYIGDIHLSHMPFSHSLLGAVVIGAASWAAARVFLKAPGAAVAIGIGVLSHIVLDLLTHAPDIAIVPWSDVKIGLGLYSMAPLFAFVIELAYGIACWWIFRGSVGLLIVVLVFNLVNITLFLREVTGVEVLLAGRPEWVVALVSFQIVITLLLTGWLAHRQLSETAAGVEAMQVVNRKV